MATVGKGEEEPRSGGRDGVLQSHQNQMGKSAEQFESGDQVEVTSERDEDYGVWFPATVIKYLSDDNSYLVQHWYKKDLGANSIQKLVVSSSKIRPQCLSDRKRSFRLSDTVDVFHDFAWIPGVIVKDFNNTKFMVSLKHTDNKMIFSEQKLRFHMEWVDGRWVDNSQARVDDGDTPQSRPSKKSKVENAQAPTLTACKHGAAKETKKTKQDPSPGEKVANDATADATASKRLTRSRVANSPQELKTPTDGAASKIPIKMPSLETESPTKGENVKGLKKDTARSRKRKGIPSKFCPSSTEGSESNGVSRTAEDTNEKGCETELIAPILLSIAKNGTNIPPVVIRHGFSEEGSQASIAGQNGQGNDPSAIVIKRKGENVKEPENDTTKTYKSRERPTRNRKSSTGGVKTAEDTAEKGHEVDPAGLLIEEISTESKENTEMEIDVNQALPFEKTIPLWDTLESMEIFKSIPQKPHFRPLESSNEESREGLALAHMVTFMKIANKIPELNIDTPRSSFENCLKNLTVLKENGFNVKLIRKCLNDMLIRKDKIEKLRNDLEVSDSEILEYKREKADIGKVVDEFDKMLEDIRAKREVAVLEMEAKESGLARSQSARDEINKHIMAVESDFKKIAELPVRK